MVKSMEMGYLHNQMEINILVNLNMTRETDKVLLIGQMVINIMENLNTINYMEMEF